MKNKSAFTLIELMVVVGLIVTLTIAGVVSYSVLRPKTRDQKRKIDLELIRASLEMYKADNNGFYPGNIYGASKPLGPYIAGSNVPVDPGSGDDYDYDSVTGASGITSYCLQTCLEVDDESLSTVCVATSCTDGNSYVLSSP